MRAGASIAGWAALAMVATGCVFGSGTLRSDDQLTPALVERVRPGEALRRFGPPDAIAGPEEVMRVPAATVNYPSGPMGGQHLWGGAYQRESATLFALFPRVGPIGDRHRVYYYRHTRQRGWSWFVPILLLFYERKSWRLESDSLVILVDEERGVVEDFVFRRG